MIKKVNMYTVVCDNCGKDANEDQEYSCYCDNTVALESAMDADWIKNNEKHYCTDCAHFDENDNLVLKEAAPRVQQTKRGFSRVDFKDSYRNECSLQMSSAVGSYVWFGINEPKLTVFENDSLGKYMVVQMPSNFQVASRMHLSQNEVIRLLPFLKNFAETGNIKTNK